MSLVFFSAKKKLRDFLHSISEPKREVLSIQKDGILPKVPQKCPDMFSCNHPEVSAELRVSCALNCLKTQNVNGCFVNII